MQILTEDSKMDSSEFRMTSSNEQQNQEKTKRVGHSKFYEVSSCVVASEKQDIMKPEDYLEEGKKSFIIYIHKGIYHKNKHDIRMINRFPI